jgi:hypothetical protein
MATTPSQPAFPTILRDYDAVDVFRGMNHAEKTANYTINAGDSGTLINVRGGSSGSPITITLPATALGVCVWLRFSQGTYCDISPNSSDKIVGLGSAGTDDKDLQMANASDGDYVRLLGDGADGWFVLEARGAYTRES